MQVTIFKCKGAVPTPKKSPEKGEVHLWYLASGDLHQKTSAALINTLSNDERVRQDSFHFAHDAHNFACARGFLRSLLGAYCNRSPALLQFRYGKQGKPTLLHDNRVSFNLSHSGEHIVVGITHKANDLGVDIESFRHIEDFNNILNVLHPREKEFITAQIAPIQQKQFFRLWTCKEAVIKATGEGLSCPLKSFHVRLETPITVTTERFLKKIFASWTLVTPNLAQNVFCAVALRQQI